MTDQNSARTSHLSAAGEPLDRGERVRRLTGMMINHPKAEAVHEAIDRFVDLAKHETHGINYLVRGPSRIGKSKLSYSVYQKLLKKEADAIGQPVRGNFIELDDRDIRPVVWMEAKSDTTTEGLLEILLEELGDPSPASGKKSEKERRLAKQLTIQRVKVVIIDEIQHFAQHRTERFRYKLGDWLKSYLQNVRYNSYHDRDVVEKSFTHVIGFGTEEADILLHKNEQFQGRNVGVHNFFPYRWDIESEREVYLDLLNTIDASIPFAEWSCFDEIHRANKLHEASNGSLGLTMKLIKAAGMMAIRDESDRILDIHLRDGFDEFEKLMDNPWRIDDEPGNSRKKAAVRPNRSTTLKGKGPSTEPSFHKK